MTFPMNQKQHLYAQKYLLLCCGFCFILSYWYMHTMHGSILRRFRRFPTSLAQNFLILQAEDFHL